MRKGDVVELEIGTMAYGGKGVARLEGLVVFVRGGVPGDRVMARIVKKKRSYLEAVVVELMEPSPDRVEAPCGYFGYCGGCQWQHVAYDRQLEYKRAHVSESLERIADLEDAKVEPVLPSKKRFAYRNKMEFSFSDRRWLLPEEMEHRNAARGFALGLHVPGTFNKVIDVQACLLQRETGNRILRTLREYVGHSGVPVYGLKSHRGFWRFLVLRYSRAEGRWMVNIVTSEERPDIIHPLAEELCSRFDTIETVVNNVNPGKASTAVGTHEEVIAGKGYIRDRLGDFRFRISANSFFQPNPASARLLYETVAGFAGLSGRETVFDLYSGTGTISIFLAGRARAVTGIEMVPDAVNDAVVNCRENGIENCRFLCGDMREMLFRAEEKPDVMVIDPPRAGMHKDVLTGVLEASPERIVYVSCNPATLARDVGLMSPYELVEVQPVDMFPHTYHIECVAALRRRRR